MIWIVLAIAVAVGIWVYQIIDTWRHDKSFGIFMGPVIGFVFAAPIVIIGNALGAIVTDPVEYKDYERNIRSISDGQRIQGDFFLGSGSIDGNPTYFFYYEVGPKQYVQGAVPVGGTVIIEEEKVVPHLEVYSEESSNEWLSLFWNDSRTRYVFYVPDGTVVPNYVLDTSAQ